MSAPQFRIQGRETGEPWKTLHACDNRALAETFYEGMSREVLPIGSMQLPRWPYMRLMLGTQLLRECTPSRDWKRGTASQTREVQA